MKKLSILSALSIGGLLMASCGLQEPASGPQPDGESTTISAALATVQTKTWLDYASGGSPLKVYWSDGDKLNVNGQISLPLSIAAEEKVTDADFLLSNLQSPYRAIYPSSAVAEEAYAADGSIAINLPAVQKYSQSSFADGSALMYGYSETEDGLVLNNLCAVVRVNIKGSDDNIVAARLESLSETAPLSGDFRLSPADGVLEIVKGNSMLALQMDKVAVDNTSGADFFFAIPEGDYSEGLHFFFRRESGGQTMQKIWRPDEPLEGGRLYSFNPIDFAPTAKEILTPDDWNEFAAACNNGSDMSGFMFKDDVVRIGADITAEDLTQITEFDGVLDGSGYTITRTDASAPLFASLTGEVRNLSLAGSLELGKKSGSPLAYTLNHGGKISSCVNNMSVNASTESDTYVSGLVTVMKGGTIESCTNNGTVDVEINVQDGIYYVGVAGIVADVQGDQSVENQSVVLTNCKNSQDGALTLKPAFTFKASSSTKEKGMKACAFAGIAGFVGNAANYSFVDCDNEGPVILSAEKIGNANGNSQRPVSVGGIIGIAAPLDDDGLLLDPKDYSQDDRFALSLNGCDNKGLIYNCGVTYATTTQSRCKMFTGGIAGSIAGRNERYASITSCASIGDVITYDIVADTPGYVVSGRPAYCAVAGGLVGFGGYLNIDGCSTDCLIGNGKRPMVAWGGAIGYAVRPFILNDTSLKLRGYYQRLEGYKMNRAVVAVVPVKHSSTAMDLSPDVEGSKITGNLSVTGCLLTSSTTLGTSDSSGNADLSSTLATEVFASDAKVKENLVCGQGFTANAGVDFSSATITYSAQ